MLSSALCSSGRDIEIVASQEVCQSVVNLVESAVQDFQMFLLTEDPMAELLKALDDERNSSGVRPFLQCLLPFFFVIAGIRAVEGGGIDTDGVV